MMYGETMAYQVTIGNVSRHTDTSMKGNTPREGESRGKGESQLLHWREREKERERERERVSSPGCSEVH